MKLTILATSRMKGSRACIAGINENGTWIRPDEKDFPHFQIDDLSEETYKNFNIIDVDLAKDPDVVLPHSEDHHIEESAKLIKEVSSHEREKFLNKYCENHLFNRSDIGISEILQDAGRSLVLVGPVKIIDVELAKIPIRPRRPRMRFEIIPGVSLGSVRITDLKFLTFNHRRLEELNQDVEKLTDDRLKKILGIEKTYLVLGLSRLWTNPAGVSACWPMVVGFHTIPDYQGEIDYDRFSK